MRLPRFAIDALILLIIAVPAFFSLLNNSYFSMHDDQHIARLFLLEEGIKQGNLYPRWVEMLGFGYGYPLYNFYPPLIYYTGLIFRVLGFSLIWSIKLVFISGFILGAFGSYYLVRTFGSRIAGFLAATLYTYFFYRAVLVYVRGALAEFFAAALLPFVFGSLIRLAQKPTVHRAVCFSIFLALVILAHPLVSFPMFFYLGMLSLLLIFLYDQRLEFIKYGVLGGLLGFGLSAFFWLPSMVERKHTLVDKILTGELADYKLHFVDPLQFIYSPWGFGGSASGIMDGMTFQLGKVHMGLSLLSVAVTILYFLIRKKITRETVLFLFLLILLIFSIYMTTEFSSPVWSSIQFLSYLQFPWRFFAFIGLFISVVGIFWLEIIQHHSKSIAIMLAATAIIGTIGIYQKYFHPQRYIQATDTERTSFEEIAWRISSTSYEFVPKTVATKLTSAKTTTLDIDQKDLPRNKGMFVTGEGMYDVLSNRFHEKKFNVQVATNNGTFQLNTYHFPGWKAYIDGKEAVIKDDNQRTLIQIDIPRGNHILEFIFTNTPVRTIGNIISIVSLVIVLGYLVSSKRYVTD